VRERVAPRAAEIDAKAEYLWDLRRLFPSRRSPAGIRARHCRSCRSDHG
jgi:hypothetical protein